MMHPTKIQEKHQAQHTILASDGKTVYTGVAPHNVTIKGIDLANVRA